MSKPITRNLALLILISVVAFFRVVFYSSEGLSALSHFSPLAAMAIFGGAYFRKPATAFGLPLLSLFISDVILSLTVFSSFQSGFLYEGWYWTYGAFVLMTLCGKWTIKSVRFSTVATGAILSVFIHWIVTDFGVWMEGRLYTKDLQGFINCLVAAIPWELSLLAGTAIYSVLLFGSFEWMQRRSAKKLAPAPQL